MHYVYILQSIKYPQRLYKGYTVNLKERIKYHNWGDCKHTVKYGPWRFVYYSVFIDKKKALAFERYLKSSSGIAFMRKRLINY